MMRSLAQVWRFPYRVGRQGKAEERESEGRRQNTEKNPRGKSFFFFFNQLKGYRTHSKGPGCGGSHKSDDNVQSGQGMETAKNNLTRDAL